MSGLSERLEDQAERIKEPLAAEIVVNNTAALLREAASLIDQQEEALRAADDLYDEALFHAVPESQLAVFTRAYRSARATSTKDAG